VSTAPIFDCGNSSCAGGNLSTEEKLNLSKPFFRRHSEQIKLIKDFSWLNFEKLDGIEAEFNESLYRANEAYISSTRRHQLYDILRNRINNLQSFINNSSKLM
jgi:hypothetical protein